MIKNIEIVLDPKDAYDEAAIRKAAAKALDLDESTINAAVVVHRTIDSRRGLRTGPVYRLKVEAYIGEMPKPVQPALNFVSRTAGTKAAKYKKPIIVGCGPAGMFAALSLLEFGIEPILVEQGKDVFARRQDLRAILEQGIVNPSSNYCFGEGGAGTFSDGKLYTRSKRGNTRRILDILFAHGASKEILVDSHPHLGSNCLPDIVCAIRKTLIENGAQLRYNTKVTDLCIKDGRVCGVVVNDADELFADAVILAVGHSARDIYHLLHRRGLALEPKPFAMGVRIEHSQSEIDRVQYHLPERLLPQARPSGSCRQNRGEFLPAARYHLTHRVNGRGLYTFCMCPGGIIIPASTGINELVLNGMSLSERDSVFANAGLVVTVEQEDWQAYKAHGALAGLELQRSLEQAAFVAGGGGLRAPAQRATDFVNKKVSQSLPSTSYGRGITSSLLNDLLPKTLSTCLQEGLPLLGKNMQGFFSKEALLLGVESRTSAPVKVLRHKETLMHVQIKGLFPSGEGAGYAGGIVSSAVDGIRCAEAVVKYLDSPIR
ncbi:MAG: FAD-binding protein [Pseudomonadota bacterium]